MIQGNEGIVPSPLASTVLNINEIKYLTKLRKNIKGNIAFIELGSRELTSAIIWRINLKIVSKSLFLTVGTYCSNLWVQIAKRLRELILHFYIIERVLLSNFLYNILIFLIIKVGTYSIHRLDSHMSYINHEALSGASLTFLLTTSFNVLNNESSWQLTHKVVELIKVHRLQAALVVGLV